MCKGACRCPPRGTDHRARGAGWEFDFSLFMCPGSEGPMNAAGEAGVSQQLTQGCWGCWGTHRLLTALRTVWHMAPSVCCFSSLPPRLRQYSEQKVNLVAVPEVALETESQRTCVSSCFNENMTCFYSLSSRGLPPEELGRRLSPVASAQLRGHLSWDQDLSSRTPHCTRSSTAFSRLDP